MAPRQKQEGWFARNILWMAPVGCIGMIAIVAIIVVGAISGIKQTFVHSEGLALASANAQVVEALGEPIAPGLGFQGDLELGTSEGDADVRFPIKGPKGEAKLHVVAEKRAGVWAMLEAEVELDDGARIDLLAEP